MQKGAEALGDAGHFSHPHRLGNTEETAVTLIRAYSPPAAAATSTAWANGRCGTSPIQRHRPRQKHHRHGIPGTGQTPQALQERSGRTAIRSSADIYELFHPLLCDLALKKNSGTLMNHAAKVIDKVRISRGGIDQTTADVRSILREACCNAPHR